MKKLTATRSAVWALAIAAGLASSLLLPPELLATPRGRLVNTDHRGSAASALSLDSASSSHSARQDSTFCQVDEHNGCYVNAAQPIGTECECVDGDGNSYDGEIAE